MFPSPNGNVALFPDEKSSHFCNLYSAFKVRFLKVLYSILEGVSQNMIKIKSKNDKEIGRYYISLNSRFWSSDSDPYFSQNIAMEESLLLQFFSI